MTGYLFIVDSDGRALDFGSPHVPLIDWLNGWPSERWLPSLLPSNATAWMRVIEAVDADRVARTPVAIIPAARSSRDAPAALLPYLAAERSVDEFSSAWPDERQRAVIDGSLAYHKVKGTRAAIDRALSPLGYSATVVEWFEDRTYREPYTFRLKVSVDPEAPWFRADRDLLVRTANAAQNLRSLLTGFDLTRRRDLALTIGAKPQRRRTLRIGQVPKQTTIRHANITFAGAIQRRSRTLRIAARQ